MRWLVFITVASCSSPQGVAGEYGSPQTFSISTTSSDAIAFGDFDGDGQVDFVIESATGGLVLFHNAGGTFSPAPVLAEFPNAVAPTAADFNADGRADLLAIDRVSGDLILALATPTGFDTSTAPLGLGPIIAGDFVPGSPTGFAAFQDKILIYRGNQPCSTAGTCFVLDSTITIPGADETFARVGRFGGGDHDFAVWVTTGEFSESLQTIVASPNGYTLGPSTAMQPKPSDRHNLKIGDVDGDGRDEILVTSRTDLEVWNAGDTLAQGQVIETSIAMGLELGHLTADANELAVVEDQGLVQAYSTQGGLLEPDTVIDTGVTDALWVSAADLDGDGIDDLVVLGPDQVAVLLARPR